MKRIVFVFSALLICGMALTFTGCGNTPTYFSCEDKFITTEDGWKRGIEDNEIISNLSTKGLNNVAYDFSYIKEQNYGLASARFGFRYTFCNSWHCNCIQGYSRRHCIGYIIFWFYSFLCVSTCGLFKLYA